MGTMTFSVFPATGVHAGIDSTIRSITKFVIDSLPPRTIKAHFIDTKDKARSLYTNIKGYWSQGGKMNKNSNIEEISKIPRPYMFVGFNYDSNFDTDETGLGHYQPYIYPNAYFIDETLQNAFPIFYDKERKIYIAAHLVRIKISAEFLVMCQEKEEQISLYVALKNELKDMYLHQLRGIKTSFTFPSVIINSLRKMLFNTEENVLDEDFDLYLKRCTNSGIVPVYRNNNKNDKFYEFRWTYSKVDFKITSPISFDEGTKEGDAYENYEIRFPSMIQIYVPVNYVLRSPEIVKDAFSGTTEIGDTIIVDSIEDKDCNIHTIDIIKKYKDSAQRCFIDNSTEILVGRDEFGLTNIEDSYEIIGHVLNGDALTLFNELTEEQRKKCFRVIFYENDHILDVPKYLTIDDKWIAHIHKGNMYAHQMVEVYMDLFYIEKFLGKNK